MQTPIGSALFATVVMSAGLATAGRAQPSMLPPTNDRPVALALVSSLVTVGSMTTTNVVALRIQPQPGWHTYWRYAGDVGSAPRISWTVPAGTTVSPLRWPTPELISSPPLASYGYERSVYLPATVTLSGTLRTGSQVHLEARVSWVACKVECVAGDADLALNLPVSDQAEVDSAAAAAIALAETQLPTPAPDWTFAAVVDSSEISLVVQVPATELRASRSQRDSARITFFVDTAGVLDHAAPQRVSTTATGFVLHLKRSDYAVNAPARITGVLVIHSPGDATRSIAVVAPVDGRQATRLSRTPSSGRWAWGRLLASGLLGLFGGTLLTLMPCVLPVLSIKAFGLVASAADDGAAARRHAVVFSFGILASMWALIAVLLGIRAAGVDVGWGYQLQNPAVLGVLALLVFSAALNMVGLFHLRGIGGSLARVPRSRDAEAFVSGVLVTALATPCSAPFLATAVAYGVAAGWVPAAIVFTAMGVGLAWPICVVAFVPALRTRLPKPGKWMATLQHVLAFPLFATAAWLTWIIARQRGPDAVAALLSAFVLLAFALWVYGRFATPAANSRNRWIARGTTAGIASLSLWLVASRSLPDESAAASSADTGIGAPSAAASPWLAYDPDTLQSLTMHGRTVLLDFTADWCLTCKVNERVAFSTASVREAIRAHDVVLMRADWTAGDRRVTRALVGFGRSSVPLVVLYGPGNPTPATLPTLLTPGIVTRAIAMAAQREPRS